MSEPCGVVWEITIPDWVPPAELSLNGRRRGSWRETWRLQQEVGEMVTVAIWQAPWHPHSRSRIREMTLERARVTVEFTFPRKRRRDPDGLAGRIKPILDTCVAEGLIKDDSTDHIELTIRARVEPGVTCTRITIEEVRDDDGDSG